MSILPEHLLDHRVVSRASPWGAHVKACARSRKRHRGAAADFGKLAQPYQVLGRGRGIAATTTTDGTGRAVSSRRTSPAGKTLWALEGTKIPGWSPERFTPEPRI